MKQVLLKRGAVLVEDVPAPMVGPNSVLVEVSSSLISTGTELATMKNSSESIFQKVRDRPDAVLKAIESIKVRGFKKTLAMVQGKFDEGSAMGYSCAGRVIATGAAVRKFQVGDRVACAGASLANHAEVVSVPSNLVVKVPAGVTDRGAAFVTIGAIALQGIRRADVRLGETVAVIGLGLIGQITVQLLRSAGCRVIGIDPDERRVERARAWGLAAGGTRAESLMADLQNLTSGMGVDAALITASTASSEPTHSAFEITRKKGRIVMVGAVGMDLKRSPFYEKEQDFLISCSYGPGRYDPAYEQNGIDYPYAFVRWTENRNMSAFLGLMEEGKVAVEPLVEQEFPVEEATKAYASLTHAGGPKPLAVLLSFPRAENVALKIDTRRSSAVPPVAGKKIRIGLIGVGEFTKSMHVPNIKAMDDKFTISAVCVSKSASALTLGRQLEAPLVTTDYAQILNDPNTDAVLIATRHNTHAAIAEAAVRAGKHVYLEKPLALTAAELASVGKAIEETGGRAVFMVGFNRRFAPLTEKLKSIFAKRTSPLVMVYRVSVGRLPEKHWTKTEEGGGRLRGEACHMIDFFQALANSPLSRASIGAVRGTVESVRADENFSATFSFDDGSLATLVYTSLGHPSLPKERIEVHAGGQSALLDDFHRLSVSGVAKDVESNPPDKGHRAMLRILETAIRKGTAFPIPWDELAATTRAAIDLDNEIWGHLPDPCAES